MMVSSPPPASLTTSSTSVPTMGTAMAWTPSVDNALALFRMSVTSTPLAKRMRASFVSVSTRTDSTATMLSPAKRSGTLPSISNSPAPASPSTMKPSTSPLTVAMAKRPMNISTPSICTRANSSGSSRCPISLLPHRSSLMASFMLAHWAANCTPLMQHTANSWHPSSQATKNQRGPPSPIILLPSVPANCMSTNSSNDSGTREPNRLMSRNHSLNGSLKNYFVVNYYRAVQRDCLKTWRYIYVNPCVYC